MRRSLNPISGFGALMVLPGVAQAQVVTGQARAVDGDSMEVNEVRVRLYGIDAPEASQTCERGGQTWQCGQEAAALLRELNARGPVRCEQQDQDQYGRMVATCTVGRIDLADAMVRAGLAVAMSQFSDAYVAGAERASALKLGIWAGSFQLPADYRADNTASEQPVRQPPAMREQAQPRRNPNQSVYFANCRAAIAAGAAPLHRGQPGYRSQMDGDNDGVACEPFRRP
jgi:endonuclease YncB( thermonuclease family)